MPVAETTSLMAPDRLVRVAVRVRVDGVRHRRALTRDPQTHGAERALEVLGGRHGPMLAG